MATEGASLYVETMPSVLLGAATGLLAGCESTFCFVVSSSHPRLKITTTDIPRRYYYTVCNIAGVSLKCDTVLFCTFW